MPVTLNYTKNNFKFTQAAEQYKQKIQDAKKNTQKLQLYAQKATKEIIHKHIFTKDYSRLCGAAAAVFVCQGDW